MKKICLSLCLVALVLTGCPKGGSLQHSVEVVGITGSGSVHLIDRQITGIVLNTAERGYATLEISTLDKIQIGDKLLEIPWKMKIRFPESAGFKIVK